MRHLAVLVLLAAACTSNSVTTTTIDLLPLPPSPEGPTTTTLTPPTTVPEPIRTTYEGALPDGTTYTVFMEGVPEEEVTGFGGVVMFESASDPGAAAEIQISFHPVEGYSYQDGEYRIPAGATGSFILKFYDHVLDELGPDAESIIQASMTGRDQLGHPTLLLQPPFRWMTPEDEIPAHLEVMYETFVVRQGCGDQAIACNAFHGIQVIALSQLALPAARFQGSNVSIDSSAPRLLSDPNRVDPGPLQTLSSPDVFWIGDEMVVWGGRRNEIDPHNQGAILDPTTAEWRVFDGPDGIVEGTGFTRGIWVGDEMLIITEDGTFAGDPSIDRWARAGEGLELRPEDPLGVIDGEVYAWTHTGIIRIGRDGAREDLGDPGYTLHQGRWRGSLLDFGGHVVASGTDCLVRRTAIWNGSGWTELERIRFRVCSWGDLVAVVEGELITWASDADPTYLYNAGELGWDGYDPVPLPAIERPSGPLVMGDRLFVPQFDEGAIFDVASRQWTVVDPPGHGSGDLMVWTGDEIFSWLLGFDAWRWTPPESG